MAHKCFGNRHNHIATKAKRPPAEKVIVGDEICVRVPLSGGKWAVVLEESYPLIEDDVWSCTAAGYAFRVGRTGEPRYVWMHRVIAGTPEGMETDHINGNPLDNRLCNLRPATRSQNRVNKPIQKGKQANKSGVTEVSKHNPSGKWTVRISVDKRPKYLGIYDDFDVAVRVRKDAEAKYYQGFRPRV